MPVQSGAATPWQEIEGPSDQGGPSVLYFRPGDVTGTADLLAEQLRVDGLIPSLGMAIRLAGEAELELGWFGVNDNDEDQLCDQDGWTPKGDAVDGPKRCVLARVNLSEV